MGKLTKKQLEERNEELEETTAGLRITTHSQAEIIIMHHERFQELETALEEANKLSSTRLGKMNEAIKEAAQLEEQLELSRKEANEAEDEALEYGNECSTQLVRIDELEQMVEHRSERVDALRAYATDLKDETTKLRHQTDSILRAHATIIRGCHP